jgi:PhzF family phenazine biosynthesis protein
MKIPIYQIDAFSTKTFGGNPAAVCPLPAWLDDRTMQSIAAENNLAQTAYIVPAAGDGYDIRWFTPAAEVDLCGHATLASAYVVFNRLRPGSDHVTFGSKSGPLRVSMRDGQLTLDFPARPATPCPPPAGIAEALGATPAETLHARTLLAVFESERDVRALHPDMAALARVDPQGVIVTAPGTDVDFVSRFFAPNLGVPEDPVTGSAHCTLTPYWAGRLAKSRLRARQVSKRGGELWCEMAQDRVFIAGYAAPYLEGSIDV